MFEALWKEYEPKLRARGIRRGLMLEANFNPPADQRDLQYLEERFNVALPADYRQMLLETNGCLIQWRLPPDPEGRVLHIELLATTEIDGALREARVSKSAPCTLIPIIRPCYGPDFIMLRYSRNDPATYEVIATDHDATAFYCKEPWIAKSVSKYLENLFNYVLTTDGKFEYWRDDRLGNKLYDADFWTRYPPDY